VCVRARRWITLALALSPNPNLDPMHRRSPNLTLSLALPLTPNPSLLSQPIWPGHDVRLIVELARQQSPHDLKPIPNPTLNPKPTPFCLSQPIWCRHDIRLIVELSQQ
jgi:hypothetical protein